ncbi:zf-HC2 domain-containing protein [Streptomyces xiaopingdaonensis]|uniref:zf-HC2 domain-containing protein n=1 Tax=Streptomyces xiaopingdaonensis TaxID=1565415 RepID=UPI0002DCE559|nr:zf-HC2 domain-containing protein [Streptomyces xiaopingdaonensis]
MTPAEHHLGDRLAALVDGELGHDARERVLAHLATCGSCKAEADAQRRVKSVFADTAPPGPSEGLLARLQGLPAAPSGPDSGATDGEDDEQGTQAGQGQRGTAPFTFEYLPVAGPSSRGHLSPERGFRIHEPERSVSRGRRFAFAAAGAFSLAALAVGGALTSQTSSSGTVASGDGRGASAGPVRTAPAGSGSVTSRSGPAVRNDSVSTLGTKPRGLTSDAQPPAPAPQYTTGRTPGATPPPPALLAVSASQGFDLAPWFPGLPAGYDPATPPAPPAIRSDLPASDSVEHAPASAQPSPTPPATP